MLPFAPVSLRHPLHVPFCLRLLSRSNANDLQGQHQNLQKAMQPTTHPNSAPHNLQTRCAPQSALPFCCPGRLWCFLEASLPLPHRTSFQPYTEPCAPQPSHGPLPLVDIVKCSRDFVRGVNDQPQIHNVVLNATANHQRA